MTWPPAWRTVCVRRCLVDCSVPTTETTLFGGTLRSEVASDRLGPPPAGHGRGGCGGGDPRRVCGLLDVRSGGAGWAAAAVTFTVWVWLTIGRMNAAQTAAHATREDPSRGSTDLLVLTGCVISLGAGRGRRRAGQLGQGCRRRDSGRVGDHQCRPVVAAHLHLVHVAVCAAVLPRP